MTPSQPRIGQINTKLICDFLIQNSYERQSDAPPHVRASPCAAAAWIDLKLCTAAICDFRQQIRVRVFARRETDGKTVFGPLARTNVRKYFRTKVRTKVLSYLRTKVLVLPYESSYESNDVRKYFRTKVLSYFRTKYFRTFVLSYEGKKVRKYESRLCSPT